MNENENVVVEDLNTTEENVTVDLENETEESIDEVKSRLAKAEELARNYKIRAEKAERKSKESPEIKNEQKNSSEVKLSPLDTLAIMRANVPEEDIADVMEYASFKKIPIAEALKSPTVKNILAQKNEERTVAQATNTGAARRGSSKVSDEKLLELASKGQLPDSDEEIARLYKLRRKK
jgi:hypothetical protein